MADNFNVLDFEGPRLTGYTLTYSTTDKTSANLTATAVATTGATAVTPFGYTTSAQANDIVTQINNLRNDLIDLKQLVTAIVDDLNG